MEKKEPHPPKQNKPKNLVAATHILKKVALQRYRVKHADDPEWKNEPEKQAFVTPDHKMENVSYDQQDLLVYDENALTQKLFGEKKYLKNTCTEAVPSDFSKVVHGGFGDSSVGDGCSRPPKPVSLGFMQMSKEDFAATKDTKEFCLMEDENGCVQNIYPETYFNYESVPDLKSQSFTNSCAKGSKMSSTSDANDLQPEKETENPIGESDGVPESTVQSQVAESAQPIPEEETNAESDVQKDSVQSNEEDVVPEDTTKENIDDAIIVASEQTKEMDASAVPMEVSVEAPSAEREELSTELFDKNGITPSDTEKVKTFVNVTGENQDDSLPSDAAADALPSGAAETKDDTIVSDTVKDADETLLSGTAEDKPGTSPSEAAEEQNDKLQTVAADDKGDTHASDLDPSQATPRDESNEDTKEQESKEAAENDTDQTDDHGLQSKLTEDIDSAVEPTEKKPGEQSEPQNEVQLSPPQPDDQDPDSNKDEEEAGKTVDNAKQNQEISEENAASTGKTTDEDKETTEEKEEQEKNSAIDGQEESVETLQPPLVDTPTEKTGNEKQGTKLEEEEGPPSDFYYNLDEFQSDAIVSQESGIPSNLLQFFHSFGYDCKKRCNLHLLKGPTALYAAGNLIHLLNLTTGEHQYIRSCGGGGIGAMAVHPSGQYFAVAEKGVKPHILVFEFPSLKLHRILRGGTEQAYSFIDFDPKGDMLASVGSYPDYMLTVWGWKKEKIMLRSKAFSQEIYRVTFSPEQEGQLTSCGTTHIRFWKMAYTFTGLKLKGELGRFGKTSLSDIEGYIQLPDGKVLSGSEWGNMLLWDGGLIKVEICRKSQKSCHAGSIRQLVIDEGELITIGVDGYVRVWEMEAIDSADTTDESDHFEIEPMNELKVGNDVQLTCMVKAEPDEEAGIEEGASIWFAQDANGGIWKLDLSFSHTTKPPQKMQSFTAGRIAGVATSPSSYLFATTGDAYVRVYEYLTKELLCQYQCPQSTSKGTSIVWPSKVADPKGTMILAGFSDGILRLLTLRRIDQANELVLKQVLKPHSSSITSIQFDNNGELLATGGTDRTVFFFAVGHDKCDPIGFINVPGEVATMQWSPAGFPNNTLLVACSNGRVVEITAPNLGSVDTTHSYKLSDVPMRHFTFQSIKSRLRRDEAREKKGREKAQRRKEREKELQRRKDRGEEISPEDGQAFLDEDPLEHEEEEEEPLYFPPEPNAILEAFYVTPGRFVLSVDDYDAGYLYECMFSDEEDAESKPAEPVRAVTVTDSDDVPITALRFSADRHKLFAGFKNGMIRVYPLEADPESVFDFDMLKEHWNFFMHDNHDGALTDISESHDGAYVFSAGADGNIFGYHSLAHEEIIKSMQGQRAKLPTPKRRSPDERTVDDIDDPNAYSIEDAKLKAEHDKMIRDAEAKKLAERRRIEKLRRSFLDLLRQNDELPENFRLEREVFELDPSIRQKMTEQTQQRIERARLEMQWEKEKLALAHRKLHNRFRAQLECDRVVVHACNSSHTVATYRVARLPEEYFSLMESVEQKVRIASLGSDSGTGAAGDGTAPSLPSDRGSGTGPGDESQDEGGFLGDARKRTQTTVLQGRQAEKVAKALRKADEAKKKHEKRQKEWEELYKSKPDKKYEDPKDVAAIKEAQANMGDFKLKTSSDFVVPEHLRMDTVKKKYQILTLQGLIHKTKTGFNQKLIALRDAKFAMLDDLQVSAAELKDIQAKLPKTDRVKLPVVPRRHPEEEPHKKFEYTRETLLKFEEDEKEREIAAAKKKRSGDGGLFGGFGDEAPPEAAGAVLDLKAVSRKTASSVASSSRSKALKNIAMGEPAAPTPLEMQLAQIENVRLRYHRDRIIRLINEKLTMFDAELRLLRHSKMKLDVDLKMADLRHITLLEELLLLKEYEKRETTLSDRVMSKRTELAELNGRAAEMQVRLDAKKRDIERLADREKALHASFAASLGENNKFADFLSKVFKKKIKRAKKKIVQEGDGEDSDVSSSDESDWSSEEDEDDSLEGGFDDSVCPPGCDQQLYDSALALREKRLDLEEAVAEEKKVAETLKKEVDSLTKKSKVMDSQLKKALDDLEEFQVEKQGKLNELDVVVPLRLNQVEHVYNAAVPSDLSQCLVFANNALTGLQRRIKELQLEKSEQRKFYKEARQQHVHLIKSGRLMEQKIKELEEKCEHMMLLKFGRLVDLDKLDSVTVNKTVEELKEQVRLNEVKNAKHLHRMQQSIERTKEHITGLTRENTKRLERLNVLMNDNNDLEIELDQRQKKMDVGERGRKKSEMREQHRLVQLVQLQAQEIQALKEEIGLLSRKGGHILPPAQPPLGQDTDVL